MEAPPPSLSSLLLGDLSLPLASALVSGHGVVAKGGHAHGAHGVAPLAQLASCSRELRMHISTPSLLAPLARELGVSPPCCGTMQGLDVALALPSLHCADVYFLQASDEALTGASAEAIRPLASLWRRHGGGRGLQIFVSGHCGRGAPPGFAPHFSRDRAHFVCGLIAGANAGSQCREGLWLHGCGFQVATRDIAHAQQSINFSRAEIRLEFRPLSSAGPVTGEAAAAAAVEWGRRWWEAQPGLGDAPPMDTPEWESFVGSASTQARMLDQTELLLDQAARLLDQTA